MTSVRIIGPGRAGRSFASAFASAGVEVQGLLGRADDIAGAAVGADLVLLAVPDHAVAGIAARVRPVRSTVVAHCSGALGLEVLTTHVRVGSLHPLVTLPSPVVGGKRLREGAYFAVAGDRLVKELVLALGGRLLEVPTGARAAYHAAACIASNHLVALLGQVQRVAASVGLPLEAFLPLAEGALEDVRELGPAAALTGPAARRDLATIESHRQALDRSELDGYDAGVALAHRLASRVGSIVEPPSVATTGPVPAGDLVGTGRTGSWR